MGWNIRLDHVAIATKDILQFKKVMKLLGFDEPSSEIVKDQGLKTYFFEPKTLTTKIELLEPVEDGSVIVKYLEKKGSGIHHISFIVDNLEELSEFLKKNSIRLIYENAKIGAHKMRVNFIHPESTGGILIEISEKLKI